jgi:hypothetical protein
MITVLGMTEAAVENRYAALVRGSSAIFPRGYLWVIPLWYVALVILAGAKDRPPSWYGLIALPATAMAVLMVIAVLSTLRSNAFVVDENGILLGLRGAAQRRFGRRRRQKHLGWYEVGQIRIASRRYGSRLDIVLAEGSASGCGRMVWRIAAAVITVLLPPACMFRMPGLLRARSDPLRYRIPLYDVKPEELRLALAPFVPPNVPIAVRPRWRTRALSRLRGLRRSRLTTAA